MFPEVLLRWALMSLRSSIWEAVLAEYVALLRARGLEVPAADVSVRAEEARP